MPLNKKEQALLAKLIREGRLDEIQTLADKATERDLATAYRNGGYKFWDSNQPKPKRRAA